jgi:hypothetical protein
MHHACGQGQLFAVSPVGAVFYMLRIIIIILY